MAGKSNSFASFGMHTHNLMLCYLQCLWKKYENHASYKTML